MKRPPPNIPDPDPTLAALQARLGHSFRDPALLVRALTHPSVAGGEPGGNQRLEFLGDSVLQLVLTETLYRQFPDDREGALTAHRATLAKGAFLVTLANELRLGECLRLGAGVDPAGGRAKDFALADALEAVVGAIYLDSDWPTARAIVLKIYGALPDRLAGETAAANPKGRLQELVQPAHGNDALRYVTEHVSGEDHEREFEARAFLNGEHLGVGRGPSKKLAEEAAARAALVTWPTRLA